jgi:hypothetical protein
MGEAKAQGLPDTPYPKHRQPPLRSIIAVSNGETPQEIDEYVGWVWNKCWATEPSTFGALYLWCSVWYIDMGNVPGGIHIAPLKPNHSDATYGPEWRMMWRHIWATSIICQLLVLIPTVANVIFTYAGFA